MAKRPHETKTYTTTLLVSASFPAVSAHQAEAIARVVRDTLKEAFANDCKFQGAKYSNLRILKTLQDRKVIDRRKEPQNEPV